MSNTNRIDSAADKTQFSRQIGGAITSEAQNGLLYRFVVALEVVGKSIRQYSEESLNNDLIQFLKIDRLGPCVRRKETSFDPLWRADISCDPSSRYPSVDGGNCAATKFARFWILG